MKTLKLYFIISLIGSVFVSCDLFFPYSLEDAPAPTEKNDPPVDDTPVDDPFDTGKPEKPEGIFFSIAANKFVRFSSGNLQYNADQDVWRFAPNQYDFIGEKNSNISSAYTGWIDLFGWGTGDSPTKKSTKDTDYTYFTDWGNNHIGNDAKNTWRTLTSDEWKYLRSRSSSLKGLGSIEGVKGMILLPDNWERPSGVTFNSGLGDGFSQNEYSKEKWQLMESAGAVFLPAAGYRYGTSYYSDYGKYWSNTCILLYDQYREDYLGDCYYYYDFNSKTEYVEYNVERPYYGYSVRLVKDIQ